MDYCLAVWISLLLLLFLLLSYLATDEKQSIEEGDEEEEECHHFLSPVLFPSPPFLPGRRQISDCKRIVVVVY